MTAPVLRVRVNAPMAAIVIAVVLVAGGGWLALVLTKTIPVATGLLVLSHGFVWLTAHAMPSAMQWYREKRLTFDLSSEPPGALGERDTPREGHR